jgi:hypothetical protein
MWSKVNIVQSKNVQINRCVLGRCCFFFIIISRSKVEVREEVKESGARAGGGQGAPPELAKDIRTGDRPSVDVPFKGTAEPVHGPLLLHPGLLLPVNPYKWIAKPTTKTTYPLATAQVRSYTRPPPPDNPRQSQRRPHDQDVDQFALLPRVDFYISTYKFLVSGNGGRRGEGHLPRD